jgi:large subunit ribosomal protein L10
MPKPVKIDSVKEIKENLENVGMVVMTDYRGLTVKEVSELRKKLRACQTEYKVYKNTLINIAYENKPNQSEISPMLIGPTAVAYTNADPVEMAKVLVDFAKAHDKMQIKGGIFASNVIDLAKITFLTKLPTKQVLLAKLAGTLQAPITCLVYGLSALPKKLVYALDAVRQQKAANNN